MKYDTEQAVNKINSTPHASLSLSPPSNTVVLLLSLVSCRSVLLLSCQDSVVAVEAAGEAPHSREVAVAEDEDEEAEVEAEAEVAGGGGGGGGGAGQRPRRHCDYR